MSESDPPRARRPEDGPPDRAGYDTEDLDRAYAAGRATGRRNTMAVLLPLLVVATVTALVPCALGVYVFLVCTGTIK